MSGQPCREHTSYEVGVRRRELNRLVFVACGFALSCPWRVIMGWAIVTHRRLGLSRRARWTGELLRGETIQVSL